ncbi:hypothetical protein A2U01_0060365, partial [Trifolium medium]|nr:hypothetical protein [Trifolium medium]
MEVIEYFCSQATFVCTSSTTSNIDSTPTSNMISTSLT